jgi:adenine-specific DNA-methyltransferase
MAGKQKVEDYRHEEATRPNNPPAGLAWQDTEKPPKRRFEYDPHLDPQLVWAGKAERTSFEVEAPSIHFHERLSKEAIIRAVQKERPQLALFEDEDLDRTKQIEFYQHEMDWLNRLILGDSLVVMTSLLEKERLGGQVQMVYVDPPYGIGFNSNFQPRISSRKVKDGLDEDLTREPEQIQAYRDTWDLGIHSYLTYLRDRLLAAHELLSDEGSMFVQISDVNVHHVRELLDEIFGAGNFASQITFVKTASAGSPSGRTKTLPTTADTLLWYAKNRDLLKYRQLYWPKVDSRSLQDAYSWVELPSGERRRMTLAERMREVPLPNGARVFRPDNLTSQSGVDKTRFEVRFEGRTFRPHPSVWKTSEEGMRRLIEANRLIVVGDTLSYVRYLEDFQGFPITDVWSDTVTSGFASDKRYVVQTNPKVIARCMIAATDPGDLVLDPTCGSGTTSFVAEMYGRRWISIDTSRVAVAIARERLLTASYPYFRLVDESRGVDGGLRYQTMQRVTLRSIARSQPPEPVPSFDRPETDISKARVSGPFSVEALSRYAVNPIEGGASPQLMDSQDAEMQAHVEVLLESLSKQGIPRKGSKPIPVTSLERIANAGILQAEGSFASDNSSRSFGVSLGPRFGPLTVSQIDAALHEAYGYDLVVFAGFAATAEAVDYVKKGKLGRFEVALLEANPDLLVGDLLKTTSTSQTFRLFAAPDVQIAEENGEYRVELRGVDSFDAATGEIVSRGQKDIAAWLLDQDYDNIVFHVTQAFFPKSGGWEALQRALKGTIDPELWEQLESFESLPFKSGEHKRAAVRVIDDSGTTSEAVLELD